MDSCPFSSNGRSIFVEKVFLLLIPQYSCISALDRGILQNSSKAIVSTCLLTCSSTCSLTCSLTCSSSCVLEQVTRVSSSVSFIVSSINSTNSVELALKLHVYDSIVVFLAPEYHGLYRNPCKKSIPF